MTPTRLSKVLHDGVLIRLDPVPKEHVSVGGIVLTTPRMARTGVVIKAGPGKLFPDKKFVHTEVVPGDRVAFFAGNMDTKNGQAIQASINEDEALIPETAILFAFELEDGEELPRIEK